MQVSPIPADELDGFVEIPKFDTGQIESIVETFQSPKEKAKDVDPYENALLIGHTSIFVDWLLKQKSNG